MCPVLLVHPWEGLLQHDPVALAFDTVTDMPARGSTVDMVNPLGPTASVAAWNNFAAAR